MGDGTIKSGMGIGSDGSGRSIQVGDIEKEVEVRQEIKKSLFGLRKKIETVYIHKPCGGKIDLNYGYRAYCKKCDRLLG